MKKPLFYACLLMGAMTAMAQEKTLSFDAQLRTRAEYRNGALFPRNEGEGAATFVNERARLGATFRRGDLSVSLSAQHTGVWGQDPQVDKQGRVAIHEAWARMTFADEAFFVQLGRQPLVYDDERLLGALDWNVAGRTHDALRAGYQDGPNQVHLILALNQNDEPTKQVWYDASKGQPYKSMEAVWYHYDGHHQLIPFDVSVLFMNLGLEQGTAVTNHSDVKHMQTLGTHINATPLDGLDATASFYYQMGNETSAWMASLKAAYRLDDAWRVHAAYDYLSGDDGKGTKNHAFSPLYGTHHKFYGAMDYFYASAWKRGNVGLQDIQLGVKSDYIGWLPMQLTYHYFATAAKVPGQDAILGLGHEVDYQLSYRLSPNVSLSGGYSFMLGQHTMDIVKGGDHSRWQDWGWLQVNVSI